MTKTVDEIARMPDPVLRNLWITQRYHELALQLRDIGLADDATWCAFAVWASKTAGASIRGDELPSVVRGLLAQDSDVNGALHRFNKGLEGWLLARLEHDHLVELAQKVNTQVAAAIANGNLLVFRELAPLYTLLVDGWPAQGDHGKKVEQRVNDAIRDLAAGGVDTTMVTPAFEAYFKALRNPKSRPTLVLAANIQAVSHEQTRLQPSIDEALDAAVTDSFVDLVHDVIVRHIPTAQVRHLLDTAVADVAAVIEKVWQTALTITMMRLNTADEKLDLHKDVPPLAGGLFLPPLKNLDGSDARDPFTQWDATKGDETPTGAEDWAVMEQRMNYIVTLFRSRQQHPALFNPPFSDAQLAALHEGRLPAGPL